MPSRYIREGLIASQAIEDAGEAAEVLFVRLLLVVDDFGRFDGRIGMITRACWPAGGARAPNDLTVNERLSALVRCGLVRTYEVDGKPYLLIPKFRQRTRAKGSKYPDPPAELRGLDGSGKDAGPAQFGPWRAIA